ncbi:MAG: hypothetical protein ACK5OX_15295 [Desertimonas sp.]
MAQPTQMRRQIGVVFQAPTLDPQLTAEENLRFHAVLCNVPAEQVRPDAGGGAVVGRSAVGARLESVDTGTKSSSTLGLVSTAEPALATGRADAGMPASQHTMSDAQRTVRRSRRQS